MSKMKKVINVSIIMFLVIMESSIGYLCFTKINIVSLKLLIFLLINTFLIMGLRFIVKRVIFLGQSKLFKKIFYPFYGVQIACEIIRRITQMNSCIKLLINNTGSKLYDINELSENIQILSDWLFVIQEVINMKKTDGKILSQRFISLQKILKENDYVIDMIHKSSIIKYINHCKSIKGIQGEKAINTESDAIFDLSITTTETIDELKTKIQNELLVFEDIQIALDQFQSNTISQLWNNDCLGSFAITRLYFEKHFQGKFSSHILQIDKENSIDYTIIKSSSTQNKRTIFIVSLTNAICFESSSLAQIFTIYLQNGIDLLFWNYRGYGKSKGFTNYHIIKNDILALYNATVKMGNWTHYGVHGICIGGIAATYLAAVQNIDILVSDQNFSSVDDMIHSWEIPVVEFLYQWLFFGTSDTIKNFVNAEVSKKIVLCSLKDQVIDDYASLKTGVSLKLIRNSIQMNKKHDRQILLKDITVDQEELTDISIDSILSKEYDKSCKKIDDLLDVILLKEEQRLFVDIMVEMMTILQLIIYNPNTFSLDVDQYQIPPEVMTIIINEESFNLLNSFFSSLSYGNTNLYWLSKKASFNSNRKKIGAFFSNLFVWKLNKVLLNEAFEITIAETLGNSLSILKALKTHLSIVESSISRKVDIYYDIFKKINEQWKRLTTVPVLTEKEINIARLGIFIRLPGTHIEELSKVKLNNFNSALIKQYDAVIGQSTIGLTDEIN